MKTLLINPPVFTLIQPETPKYVTTDRGYNPPLGLISIGTCINQRDGLKAEILDSQVEELNFKQILDEIKRRSPDVIGMAAGTFTFIDCLSLSKEIKLMDNSIKIVLGGPHANLFPVETIGHEPIDYLMVGEGEISFPDLLQKIDRGAKDLKDVGGILYKENGKIINTGPSIRIENLDDLPIPDRTLTDYKKYSSIIAKRSPITTAVTSRGCPYKCTFCDRPQMGGKTFRMNSAKRIVEEIESCIELGIHEIMYYDDTFTMSKGRVTDMCKMIIDKGLDVGWDVRTRVDKVDAELLKLMKKAGCERINFGVESGTEKGLSTVKKEVSLNQIRETFQMAKDAKLIRLAYFIIGLPHETKEELMETIKFSKEINPDFVHYTVFTPFPRTEIWRELLSQGKTYCEDAWRNYAKNPTTAFDPPTCNEYMTKAELFKLLDYAYKSFYFRPSYMLKKAVQVRSFGEFKRKTKAAFKVLLSKSM